MYVLYFLKSYYVNINPTKDIIWSSKKISRINSNSNLYCHGRQYQSFFIPHKTNEMDILSELLVIMIIKNMQIIFQKDTLHKIVEKNVNEGRKTTIM